MPQRLREIQAESNLLLLKGTNSDSGKNTRTAAFDGISQFQTNQALLHPVMSELRVIKTEMELEVLRYVSRVSSAAHRHVMRQIKSGKITREYQAEAEFMNYSYSVGGCRQGCEIKLISQGVLVLWVVYEGTQNHTYHNI